MFFYFLFNSRVRERAGWGGLIAMAVIVALVVFPILLYNIFLRRSYQYTITNKGVKITGGIFTKITRDVSFSKITDVTVSQNILEKIFRIYELHIQTAGSRAQQPEISFLALDNADIPKNLILRHMHQHARGYSE